MGAKKTTTNNSADQAEKIRSLQEMIATAEKTILSAKAMLAQVQGNTNSKLSPSGIKNGIDSGENQVILGVFDGQIMQGEDGKQYPVPANYASKSKLVEGDTMKLTITQGGGFIYKQIGPVERKYLIGIVIQDEYGNYTIRTDSKDYRVLLAAATYFKIEAGDEVTIIVPRDEDAVWGAIENIVRKGSSDLSSFQEEDSVRKSKLVKKAKLIEEAEPKEAFAEEVEVKEEPSRPSAIEALEQEIAEERKKQLSQKDILDEWTPDIEELRKEAGKKSD